MPHLAALDPSAKSCGAVNLLKWEPHGYVGYNADIDGVLGALHHHHMANVRKAVILGNGGAARAAKIALERLGCQDITILHRKPLHGSGDVLINATSASPSELLDIAPVNHMENFGCVFDMNYPKHNAWLDAAQGANIIAFDGKAMLVYQAIRAFEILWGVPVPQDLVNKILIDII